MVAEQTGAGRFLDAQSVYYFWKNVFNVTLHCCLMINLIWFWVLHTKDDLPKAFETAVVEYSKPKIVSKCSKCSKWSQLEQMSI